MNDRIFRFRTMSNGMVNDQWKMSFYIEFSSQLDTIIGLLSIIICTTIDILLDENILHIDILSIESISLVE